MQSIHLPQSLIYRYPIKQDRSFAVPYILFKLSLVDCPIVIVQSAFAPSQTIPFRSLVFNLLLTYSRIKQIFFKSRFELDQKFSKNRLPP
jgi:hypothetical protein